MDFLNYILGNKETPTFNQPDSGTVGKISMDAYAAIRVNEFMPPYAELARNGYVFAYSGGVVANAVAPVTDVGTTAAAYALYNGQAVSSGILVIPLFIITRSSSGTMGLGMAQMAGLSPTIQGSAVSAGTGVVGPKNLNPLSTRTSSAVLGSAVTLAGAPAWVALNGRDTPAAVEIGAAVVTDVRGLFEVPPGFALGLTVLAPAGTTAKFTTDVIFAEIKTGVPY